MDHPQIRILQDKLAQKEREIEGLKKMNDDTSEWMEQDNTDREKLVTENENLSAQLEKLTETYKTWMKNEDLEKDKLKAQIKNLRQKWNSLPASHSGPIFWLHTKIGLFWKCRLKFRNYIGLFKRLTNVGTKLPKFAHS